MVSLGHDREESPNAHWEGQGTLPGAALWVAPAALYTTIYT